MNCHMLNWRRHARTNVHKHANAENSANFDTFFSRQHRQSGGTYSAMTNGPTRTAFCVEMIALFVAHSDRTARRSSSTFICICTHMNIYRTKREQLTTNWRATGVQTQKHTNITRIRCPVQSYASLRIRVRTPKYAHAHHAQER